MKAWRAGRCAAALGAVVTTPSWEFTQWRTERKKRNSWGWMCLSEGGSLPNWGDEKKKPTNKHILTKHR